MNVTPLQNGERLGRGLFEDSDSEEDETIQAQLNRVRATSTLAGNPEDGKGLQVTYVSEKGEKKTIRTREKLRHIFRRKQPSSFGKTARVAMIALFACLGSTLFGLDIGYIGPVIESRSFKLDIAHTMHEMDSFTEGLIVSLFSIGAMCTAFPVVSSYFLDKWGRKTSIMFGTFFFMFGSLVQGTSSGTVQLLIGRFIAGMSIGLLSSVIVLYQSEMAPANLRGALSTLYQLGITFGILLAAYIDQTLVDRDEGWRFVMAIICIPAALLLFGMMGMPRSPRWLVQVGRRKEALKVLLSIRSESEAIQEELEIYEEVEKAKLEGEPAWSELLHGRIFRLLIVGVTLQLLQQLVGMNAFMYFGPKIFKAAGFDKNTFTTICNFVNFLSTIPAVFLADVAGRRSLMLWSSIGMSIACCVMGVAGLLYAQEELPDALATIVASLRQQNPALADQATAAAHDLVFSMWSQDLVSSICSTLDITKASLAEAASEPMSFVVTDPTARWVIALSAFFFVSNFAYGFGPIVWVYCAEIFPLRFRSRAVGVCTWTNWVGNTLIAQFTPMLLSSIQFSTFFVFGFFCVLSVFVSAWLPETKGVPLELIQRLFDRKRGFRSSAAPNADLYGSDSESGDSSSGEE